MYAEQLKKTFSGITLKLDDLYLLEEFQIIDFEKFAPKKELAVVLHSHVKLKQFLLDKAPSISTFLEEILAEFKPLDNLHEIDVCKDTLVWELGLMVISNKFPEEYDKRVHLDWDIEKITTITPLKDKVVIDAGAGTGNIAFLVSSLAKTVYAVEPVGKFRNFIRKKGKKKNFRNIFAVDGFLHEIPLASNSADILITSNAIGWAFEEEMVEIERVIKPNGYAIHLFIGPKEADIKEIHEVLTSIKWNYEYSDDSSSQGIKRKYWKKIG